MMDAIDPYYIYMMNRRFAEEGCHKSEIYILIRESESTHRNLPSFLDCGMNNRM